MELANERTIRYAVVGLGYIAQKAVLPAFKHADDNSELTALVSDNPEKLQWDPLESTCRHASLSIL